MFGGKLTTYRKLAEHALEKLAPYYKGIGPAWTKGAVLPGGDIGDNRDDYAAKLRRRFPFITEGMARHYARTYGSNTELFLGDAKDIADLGEHFGHELYEAELRYGRARVGSPHGRRHLAPYQRRDVAECRTAIACGAVAAAACGKA